MRVKALVLLLTLGVPVLLASCGHSYDEVRDFFAAWEKKDVKTINALLCDDSQRLAPDFFAAIKSVNYDDLDYQDKGRDKTQAQVKVSGSETISYADGEKQTNTFETIFVLRHQDDDWCIYDINRQES